MGVVLTSLRREMWCHQGWRWVMRKWLCGASGFVGLVVVALVLALA
jgi:hypothetical protein